MYPKKLIWEKVLPLDKLTELTVDLYKELQKDKYIPPVVTR